MDTVYGLLGRFVIRWRYLVVALWLALTVTCVAVFPSLASTTQDFTLASLLPLSAPSAQAARLAAPLQNTQAATTTLVAVRDTGPLTADDQATVGALETQIRAIPHVLQVQDLAVSPDGQVRQALIQANVPQDGSGAAVALVKQIRQDFPASTGLTFHLTGPIATTVDTNASVIASQGNLQNLTLLFILVLLLLAFRSLLAPLVTLLPAVVVLLLSSPIIAGAVTHLGIRTSVTTPFVLIVLVLGAGTDYGVFLLFRVREEVRDGLTTQAAILRAIQTVGATISFSALTVIVALSLLNFAHLGLYQSLGPALAIGIALMWFAALTLLPALLAIVGRAVFWPARLRTTTPVATGLWGKLTARFIQRPRTTLLSGIVVFLILACGLIGTTITASAGTVASPANADSTLGAAVLAAHFPGTTDAPTLILLHFSSPVWDRLTAIVVAQQVLSTNSAIASSYGPLNPNGVALTAAQLGDLHSLLGAAGDLPPIAVPPGTVPPALYNAYRATNQYLSADGQTLQFIAVLAAPIQRAAAQAAIPTLRVTAQQMATTAGAEASGIYSQDAVLYDVQRTSQDDLARLFPLIGILMALLLALVLRSVVAPLYLMVSVALSYLAALGLVGFVSMHIAGLAGMNFIVPFVLFVFLAALGSDYNLLVMTRIREEAQIQPLATAVREAMAATGGTVTTAGVILAGSFAILAISSATAEAQQFSLGIAAGILLDTFLIRTLLLPALVVLLGRWNWWPVGIARQLSPPPAAGSADV